MLVGRWRALEMAGSVPADIRWQDRRRDHGLIAQRGSPQQLYGHPESEFVAGSGCLRAHWTTRTNRAKLLWALHFIRVPRSSCPRRADRLFLTHEQAMTPEELLDHADRGELWPRPAGRTDFVSVEGAYQAALAVRALRCSRGEIPLGYKVGFTNRTIWQRYGVFAPIWGSVWDTTVSRCDRTGGLSLDGLCQPRIEPEAVFGLRRPPQAGANLDDLFDSLDWVAPGFEIVQSHLPDWKFSAPETVADGGLHGRLLVGRPVPVRELAASADGLSKRLASARVELCCDGVRVECGAGSNVLDSPLRALLHFVSALRSCQDAPELTAADIVTTGTWTDAWPVRRGQTWSSAYNDALDGLLVTFN
jgi:2-keto-4-pentenoate hydratase